MDIRRNIQDKRWFMGKGGTIESVTEVSRAAIAGNGIAILRVKSVQGGTPTEDLYATIDDEGSIGTILEEAFSSSEKIYDATTGHIAFKRLRDIEKIAGVPQSPLRSIAPVQAEQSNSAFTSERFFFKLYRRLQPGAHPEVEILEHLEQQGFEAIPHYYGSCRYIDSSGTEYALGILEERLAHTQDAWAFFSQGTPSDALEAVAYGLGEATAKMHRALKSLSGTESTPVEIPFEKLERLLRDALSADALSTDALNGDAPNNSRTDAPGKNRELMENVLGKIPALKELASREFAKESAQPHSAGLPPQRMPTPYGPTISRFSTSKGNRRGRLGTAGRSVPRSSMSPECSAVSATREPLPAWTAPLANARSSRATRMFREFPPPRYVKPAPPTPSPRPSTKPVTNWSSAPTGSTFRPARYWNS